jgi:hypothetical protein
MTNNQVHGSVVRWIETTTGVNTIKAFQSGKAPAEPYIMVNMTGFFEVRAHAMDIEYSEGADPPGPDLPPITAKPVIEAEWRFSVHAYGASPTDILRPVISAVKLAQAQEPLMPGLIIHEISQIRHVPDWINERWQLRAQMDFNLRGLTKDGHVIDVIEEASFDIARA